MKPKALILAGGRGKRMHPYSKVIPKPLLPVGDKSILEHIWRNFKKQGINDITISLGYGASMVKAFCQSKKWKVKFVEDKEPLKTAGPVGLLKFNSPLIVMNGDILTDLNFNNLYACHTIHKPYLTVVYKTISFTLPLGVLGFNREPLKGKVIVDRVIERPHLQYNINCGIYVVDPKARKYIKGAISFTDLITKLIKDNKEVLGYKIPGKWKALENMVQLEEEDKKRR